MKRYNTHKATLHSNKCDIINDVKLFPAVYRKINCRKLLTLSNQTLRYKSKCIRIFTLALQLLLETESLFLYFNGPPLGFETITIYVSSSGCHGLVFSI